MKHRINVGIIYYTILGAMIGAIFALISAILLDYMLNSYSLIYCMTFGEWLMVLIPFYGVIGALFNLVSAIFLYDENTIKPKRRYKRKKNSNK